MLQQIRLDQTMTCPAATTSRCATRLVGKQEDAYRPCSRTYDVKPRTRIGYYRCLCDTPTVLPRGLPDRLPGPGQPRCRPRGNASPPSRPPRPPADQANLAATAWRIRESPKCFNKSARVDLPNPSDPCFWNLPAVAGGGSRQPRLTPITRLPVPRETKPRVGSSSGIRSGEPITYPPSGSHRQLGQIKQLICLEIILSNHSNKTWRQYFRVHFHSCAPKVFIQPDRRIRRLK